MDRKRLEIGLDFDGVIIDYGRFKRAMGNLLLGIDVPENQFTRRVVVDKYGITDTAYTMFKRRINIEWKYAQRMEAVTGALDGIQSLRTDGHSVRVVTSRSGTHLDTAMEWARVYELSITFTGVGEGVSKARACTGLDVFIDDGFHKLEELVDVVPHRFLFGWGYNSHIETGSVARRVNSWAEFLEAVVALEGAR